MPFINSSKENRYWLYAMLVFLAIFSSLAMGRPLQVMLRDQNVQAVFFLTGLILIGTTIIVHGFRIHPGKREMAIWFGLAAVYIMLIFRLGAPERSHVMEYSVLAIFIHKALMERFRHRNEYFVPGLIALVVTILIGVADEGIQKFLPDRVFDTTDILFNTMAAFMAIGGSLILFWAKKKFRKKP